MRQNEALMKRLGPYWKMEAGNAVLIPAFLVFMAEGKIGWISLAAMLPMIGLLLVGAAYWREKLRQLRDPARDIAPLLRRIALAQKPLLALTVLACGLAGASWLMPGLSTGLADRVVASVAAGLSLLEYANYYHRQLQHFDNRADFRRFLAGRGFRRSKLAKDMDLLRD